MKDNIAILAGLIGVCAAYRSSATSVSVECRTLSKALVIDTAQHTIGLCEDGHPAEGFSVRLGRKGTGKTQEGDGRTPLGRYAIGEPRRSVSYGTFVPIEYPTLGQRRSGFTGGAIGLHGPDRRIRWAGSWVNLFDTTDGCIGVATDQEMARITEWIRSRKVKEILLR